MDAMTRILLIISYITGVLFFVAYTFVFLWIYVTSSNGLLEYLIMAVSFGGLFAAILSLVGLAKETIELVCYFLVYSFIMIGTSFFFFLFYVMVYMIQSIEFPKKGYKFGDFGFALMGVIAVEVVLTIFLVIMFLYKRRMVKQAPTNPPLVNAPKI